MAGQSPPHQSQPQRRRPPAYLFALGRAEMPPTCTADGISYRFVKLFKHDFFAATALYERTDDSHDGVGKGQAVLKIQRTYPLFGIPMAWLGRRIAGREIRIYKALQGIAGIPRFLGAVGSTGFLHEFIPGVDLHAQLPLTPDFFEQLDKLFADLHARHIAYVDSNKRENILFGEDARPWLIDFQISFQLKKGDRDNFIAKALFRRFVRADTYHFYKHKTRLLPAACSPDDFEKSKKRGILHQFHRLVARPLIVIRRKFLSRYDLANTR